MSENQSTTETYTETQIATMAEVCHTANAEWCRANGDSSQKSWSEAEGWQRNSAITGVKWAIENPEAPASAQHDAWMDDKIADGWSYGPEKNPGKKQHPCLVPFDELPEYQQKKDKLFRAIVSALK